MSSREEKTKAVNEILLSGNSGLRASFAGLLRAHIAEDMDALESAEEPRDIYRLQGRIQAMREVLNSITGNRSIQ
jgi:hypothetical protein